MIFLYVYSRDLTFSLGSSARSSAPSLCSPRCSSRRCPARLATSCFADSGVWSRAASPCCPQRLLPPPRWRPCNHHHPPSRITSPPEMDPNDRQNTRLDLTGKSITVSFFLSFLFFPPNRRSNTAPILFPAHRRQTDHAAAPAILANVSIRAPRGNIPSGNNPARLRAAERSIPSRDLSFSKYRTTRRWQRS